jgi:hypothetical protein
LTWGLFGGGLLWGRLLRGTFLGRHRDCARGESRSAGASKEAAARRSARRRQRRRQRRLEAHWQDRPGKTRAIAQRWQRSGQGGLPTGRVVCAIPLAPFRARCLCTGLAQTSLLVDLRFGER